MRAERSNIVDILRQGDDALDAFPAEEREAVPDRARTNGMLIFEHAPVSDRAIKYDSHTLALQKEPSLAPRAHHAWSWTPTVMLGLVAVIGWGAFLFERTRAFPLDTSSPTGAIAERADAPLEARPLTLVAGAARPVRAVRPPPSASAASIAALAPAPEPSATSPPVTPAMDVSGAWVFATRTGAGTRVTSQRFHAELKQEGGRVYGVGRPVTETGAEIGRASRSPITIRGTIGGEELTLTFRDSATRRAEARTFVLRPQADGHMRGRVNTSRSNAAAEAHRR